MSKDKITHLETKLQQAYRVIEEIATSEHVSKASIKLALEYFSDPDDYDVDFLKRFSVTPVGD